MYALRLSPRAAVLAVSFALVAISGCGSSGPELPPRAKVHGRVTLDGKALAPGAIGSVTFVPDGSRGTTGPPAVGGIDANGSYELSTDRQSEGDGAVVGFHQVRIRAREPAKDAMQSMTPSLIPERYEDEKTSGFKFEVKADQENVFDLPLTSK